MQGERDTGEGRRWEGWGVAVQYSSVSIFCFSPPSPLLLSYFSFLFPLFFFTSSSLSHFFYPFFFPLSSIPWCSFVPVRAKPNTDKQNMIFSSPFKRIVHSISSRYSFQSTQQFLHDLTPHLITTKTNYSFPLLNALRFSFTGLESADLIAVFIFLPSTFTSSIDLMNLSLIHDVSLTNVTPVHEYPPVLSTAS